MSSSKSVDPISTLVACASLVKSEAALVSMQDGGMSVCKHIKRVIGGHIARLGEFSSLACTAWQTGGVAPFFFFSGGSITALICHPSLALMCESKTCCAY